jgi:hypothetical protein
MSLCAMGTPAAARPRRPRDGHRRRALAAMPVGIARRKAPRAVRRACPAGCVSSTLEHSAGGQRAASSATPSSCSAALIRSPSAPGTGRPRRRGALAWLAARWSGSVTTSSRSRSGTGLHRRQRRVQRLDAAVSTARMRSTMPKKPFSWVSIALRSALESSSRARCAMRLTSSGVRAMAGEVRSSGAVAPSGERRGHWAARRLGGDAVLSLPWGGIRLQRGQARTRRNSAAPRPWRVNALSRRRRIQSSLPSPLTSHPQGQTLPLRVAARTAPCASRH